MVNEAKTILLATIGAASLTYEKASDAIVELVNKGRLTVDDGRELTEELKRDFKNEATDLKKKVKDDLDIVKPVTKGELRKIIEEIEIAHKKEISILNNRIDELQNLVDEILNKEY